MTAPPPSEPGARPRREGLAALLVLLVLLAAFFEKPLRRIADHHYTTADLTQSFTLTRIEPRYTQMNSALSDPVVQMQPWLLYARAELEQGRFPLWNPLNGCGAPHFANMQSAVLSPLSVPFYVLPLRWALLVAPLLKLLLAAGFTFLFLRRIALSFWPALTGAVAYAWSGYGVLLEAYPHTAAALVLPAGLFFADLARQRLRERSPHAWSALLGLIASLALGIYAGQPEPFYFCALAVGFWTLFGLHEDWRAEGGGRAGLRRMLGRGGALAAAAVLAAGLGALQLLPFFEYLRTSALLEARSGPQTPIFGNIWPFLFFPNLLGNPVKAQPGWPIGPMPYYEQVNCLATSGLVVFLALVSFAWLRRSRAHAFFALVLTWWIVYAFDALGLGRAAGVLIPGLDAAPMTRSQPVGIFALCVCAAFALERIGALAGRARALATPGLLLIATGLAALVASEGLERLARFLARSAPPPEFVSYAREHVLTMTLVFALGVLFTLALPWLARARLRAGAQLAIVLIVFVPWGWMLRNYNTTVPDRFVFPRTEALDRLRSLVRGERLLIVGTDTLPPDTNLVYGLDLPTNYDALGLREYDRLWQRHFGKGDNWRPARKATRVGLSLLGLRRILTKGAWLPVDTTFAGIEWSARERFRAGPIVPGLEISQTFTATQDELQAIRVEVATDQRANRCTLWFVLEDAESGALIDTQSLDASNLRQDENGRCELVFRFDPIAGSRARRYRMTLASPDATSSQCLIALATHEFGRVEEQELVKRPGAPLTEHIPGELRVGGERVQGGLVLDLSYDRELFRRITDIAGYTLWSFEPGADRFQLVDRARTASSSEDALEQTCAPGFDPAREVILEGAGVIAPPASARGPEESLLTIEQREANRARLQVRRSTSGWLVAAQPFYPGWHARVNGVETPILRANSAFCAVALPAGSSEVELYYAPSSVRRGLNIALASLAGTLLFLALARRAARIGLAT